MHDAQMVTTVVGQFVSVVQAVAGGDHNSQATLERKPARITSVGQNGPQVLAVHVLHRHVVLAFGFAEIDHLCDVGVVETCGQPRFVEQHADESLVVPEVREHELQRNEFAETTDPLGRREVQLRHASMRQPLQQCVAAELYSRRKLTCPAGSMGCGDHSRTQSTTIGRAVSTHRPGAATSAQGHRVSRRDGKDGHDMRSFGPQCPRPPSTLSCR